jgi:hypothetical protein
MSGSMSRVEDVETNLDTYNDGYPAFARWMAQDPDNETLIFRKFDSLSTRNLLYLQAELMDIQRQMFDLESQIAASRDVTLMQSVRQWETFVEQATQAMPATMPTGSTPLPSQPRPEIVLMDLVLSTRTKLKEYRKLFVTPVQLRH